MSTKSGSKDFEGYRERRYASMPAVWGEAMEVPEIVLVAVGLPVQVDLMFKPGANTSTHLPWFEK